MKHASAIPKIAGYNPVLYFPDTTRQTQQDHWTWPWPINTTRYGTRVTSCWWGNQLPNAGIAIPGMYEYLWTFSRGSHAIRNVNLNQGYNLQTMGVARSSNLMANAQAAWASQET